jgi:hypothetical protein
VDYRDSVENQDQSSKPSMPDGLAIAKPLPDEITAPISKMPARDREEKQT